MANDEPPVTYRDVPSATISFDDPHGRAIDEPVATASDARPVLGDLQRRYPGLNFMVDVTAPGRDRISVVLAQDQGAVIVWRDVVLRTRSDTETDAELYVWDGAGVEMPAKYFVPLARLFPAIEEWIAFGTLSRTVTWTPEDY